MSHFSTKNIFKPTPSKFRKLGNALVAASQGVAIPAVLTDHKWLALSVLAAGWVGKILTEFFSEDEKDTLKQS